MNLNLEVVSHDFADFSHVLPAHFGYPRLKGGEVLRAEGKSGTIVLQEFALPDCIFRYGVIHCKEPFAIRISHTVNGFHCLLLQRGHVECTIPGLPPLHMRQGQCVLVEAEPLQYEVRFPAGKHVIGFELFFPTSVVTGLFEDYPGYNRKTQLRAVPPKAWELVMGILFFDDGISERSYYFSEEAKEILALLLEPADDTKLPALTAEQIEKVQLVQAKILADLGEKESTRQLSKLVGWSESILKRNFKSYTGQAIHQFRKAKRLDLALELIYQGKLVKEVADELGLSQGWLIKLYKQRYGTTPATMRKK